MSFPRTIVYIDGFNLYYGALKDTPYRWLDLEQFCINNLRKNDLIKINYFTAMVEARPSDLEQPVRQDTYIRALKTLPHLDIILGHFLTKQVRMPLVNPRNGIYTELVWKTEEKGSDVNLAVNLVRDGFIDAYDVAVIISNDSDLLQAIKIVRNDLHKKVVILNPRPKSPSVQLKGNVDLFRDIRPWTLQSSQFPDTISDGIDLITKPSTW